MSDGLRKKYIITKADTGEEVDDCFVLRPVKDAAAVVAIRAYASVTKNKTLSADLLRWVGRGSLTNGDRIRQKTDEELAKLIEPAMDCTYCPAKSEECDRHYEDEEDGEMPPDCTDIILHWLRKEADE